MLDSNTTIKGVHVSEIYVDQGIINGPIFAAYTPYGIQRMESKLAGRIQAYGRGDSYTEYNWKGEIDWVYTDTYEGLLKEVRENKHLHRIIKQNLIQNLRMYRRQNESINT